MRDVAEAYCTVPIHPSEWPAAIVRINGNSYGLDTTTSFGAAPSAGIYGQVHDGGADIIHSHGISPIAPWVDDHVIHNEDNGMRISLPKVATRQLEDCGLVAMSLMMGLWTNLSKIADLTAKIYCVLLQGQLRILSFAITLMTLIISWTCWGSLGRNQKTHLSGLAQYTWVSYWDLSSSMVTLATEKKAEYLQEIWKWQAHPMHSCKDGQRLYGKILHTCHIIPQG
jgi:hypothetical protein